MATRFTHAAAVDVWDAQYRWRVGNELRDHTIDATWERVARAVAATNPIRAYVEAFSDWRLLPDERLLRLAGTGVPIGRFEQPRALLNAGAFVLHPRTTKARFDLDRFAATASLAVRLLDDALASASPPTRTSAELRIGMLGVADAMALMDLRYDSAQALEQVAAMAEALATGCLRGSVDLARERGSPIGAVSPERIASWERQAMAPSLIDDAKRWGVRHRWLTAIESWPNLAMLANNASDALDPVIAQMRHRRLAGVSAGADEQSADAVPLTAQIAWRGAAQPWIDAPISYPLTCDRDLPDSRTRETCLAMAQSCGLPKPAFRSAQALEIVP